MKYLKINPRKQENKKIRKTRKTIIEKSWILTGNCISCACS